MPSCVAERYSSRWCVSLRACRASCEPRRASSSRRVGLTLTSANFRRDEEAVEQDEEHYRDETNADAHRKTSADRDGRSESEPGVQGWQQEHHS